MAAGTSTTSIARLIVSVGSLTDARRFYEGLLGLNATQITDGFAWFTTADGVELMLHERPSTPSDRSVALGFSVVHLDGLVAAWQNDGGGVVTPPTDQAWGERMAVVRDPDGHLVCLYEDSDTP